MNVLRMTLKKKWFDMIASGEKKEEYREIKQYWISRICYPGGLDYDDFREYTEVEFINGYSKTSPRMTAVLDGIRIGEGKKEWGAEPGEQYIVLELGDIIKKP